ncbi:hypothetical protein L1987_55277 [Smallanthus sonchifolius]|uniref:Uncharacterized protein n=1 Tax=Smallanthus sonchifolius TaxID=185202 RepID=A0ACB9E9K8_9ASTR|nr:hypothetical protein L1987_55277 [Smallanthus sonchifolius]
MKSQSDLPLFVSHLVRFVATQETLSKVLRALFGHRSSQFMVDDTNPRPNSGNNVRPIWELELGYQQPSGVKRKRADLKSFRSNIVRLGKTLTKKVIPDLNLSDEVCPEKSRNNRKRGFHMHKNLRKKGVLDVGVHLDDTTRGVEDVSQTEDWSEESDEELIIDKKKGLSAQEVGKEVADTIKVGQGVGIQLDGFEERVTVLVAELVNQNRSQ